MTGKYSISGVLSRTDNWSGVIPEKVQLATIFFSEGVEVEFLTNTSQGERRFAHLSRYHPRSQHILLRQKLA